MKLKDIECRKSSVPSGKTQKKLFDGESLYLYIHPSNKTWKGLRVKHRINYNESLQGYGKSIGDNGCGHGVILRVAQVILLMI